MRAFVHDGRTAGKPIINLLPNVGRSSMLNIREEGGLSQGVR